MHDPEPLASVAVHNVKLMVLRVTMPVAVKGVTDEVKVTGRPAVEGFGTAITAVQVAMVLTVIDTVLEVAKYIAFPAYAEVIN